MANPETSDLKTYDYIVVGGVSDFPSLSPPRALQLGSALILSFESHGSQTPSGTCWELPVEDQSTNQNRRVRPD